MTVPATTVNKVCLSGINTVYLAHQMISVVMPRSWWPGEWSR